MNKNILLTIFVLSMALFSAAVSATVPTISPSDIEGMVITSGGDRIEITFNIDVAPVDNIWSANEFGYIQSPSGSNIVLTNAQFSYSSKKLTITLNEAVDNAHLAVGNYISVRPGTATVHDAAVSGDFLADTVVVGTVPIKSQNMLVFNNLEWDVNFPRSEDPDDNDGDLNDGDNINIGEGSTVKISGEVENIFPTDMTIEDIEVTLSVDNMDSGDDIDDDVSIDDLEDGQDDSFSFEFKVPYDEFDDGDNADATLRVEGTDENGNTYEQEIGFSFEMEQDSEEVTIMEASLDNAEVSCEKEAVLTVEIKNTGKDEIDDQNSVTITVVNSKLNIGYAIRDIEMSDSDEDDSNVQTFSIPLNISGAAVSTTLYPLTIKAYTDVDEISDVKTVSLKVSECKGTVSTTVRQTTTTMPVVTTTTVPAWTQLPNGQQVGPNYAQFPEEESQSKFTGSMTYIIMLGAIILLLIVVGILLLASFMRRR